MTVNVTWCGALTDTSVRIVAHTGPASNGSVQIADNEAMTGAATFGPVTVTATGMLSFTVTGLTANTRYWYVVNDGTPGTSYKGTFRTHPGPAGQPLSYVFGAAGDAGLTGDGEDAYITNAVSNHPVFDTMRAQSRAEEWAWFSHLGDIHYRNIATNDPSLFRAGYFETHNYGTVMFPNARQGKFFREQAITYSWDDHDFGPNNSDRTSPSAPAAQLVYREYVPHYPLADPAGIYQSWQVGRVLYISSDVRSFRDPNTAPQVPTKTMLGAAQKTWMENLLATSNAEALVWMSASRLVGGDDTWNSFRHERAQIIQMFGDYGWLGRTIFMTADMHALSISTGPNNPHGNLPMFMFASMDSGAWDTGTEYDIGSVAGRGQYGTMRVQDNGHTIALTGTGYSMGTPVMSHTVYVNVGSPVIALDYAGGHISPDFLPAADDAGVTNDVTATRQDGGQARFAKTTGPMNTSDPAKDPQGIGTYDGGNVTLNVATDDQLMDQAAWRVHLGTAPEERFPSVHIDLAANPGLADEMQQLALGDRLTVANPPVWLAPEQIQLIAEGGTETIGLYDWDVTLNASPGAPWRVARMGDPVTGKADTDGCQLASAVTATATSLPITVTAGPRWVIAPAPTAMDRYARTVTGGWGTAELGNAWAWTGGAAADYSVAGGTATHTHPSRGVFRITTLPVSTADTDVTVMWSTPTAPVGDAHYVWLMARYASASTFLSARVHLQPNGIPLLTVRDRIGGTETSSAAATLGTLRPGAWYRLRLQVTGTTARARCWLDGTEEPSSWQATWTTTITAAGGVGLRTFLAATTTTTLPVPFSFRDFTARPYSVDEQGSEFPFTVRLGGEEMTVTGCTGTGPAQTMTVLRGTNGITRAHPAGTPVSLANPARLAL